MSVARAPSVGARVGALRRLSAAFISVSALPHRGRRRLCSAALVLLGQPRRCPLGGFGGAARVRARFGVGILPGPVEQDDAGRVRRVRRVSDAWLRRARGPRLRVAAAFGHRVENDESGVFFTFIFGDVSVVPNTCENFCIQWTSGIVGWPMVENES